MTGRGAIVKLMAVSRAERRFERRPRVAACFPPAQVEPALDLLELLELAWHDCYGDITPSEEIVDDVLLLADGDLAGLIGAVRLATTDWRDLKLNAAERRDRR